MSIRRFKEFTPLIAESAFIDEAAVVIGQVTIGEDASIWPGVVLRGDIHHIRVGAKTNVQDGTIVHVTHASDFVPGGAGVSIGEGVTVGHQVTLHGCTIQDYCLIGMGSILLDKCVIESGAMIGAGSLVPPKKVITGGYLWVGSPVKKIRELTEQEKAFLTYSAKHYVKLGREHAIENELSSE